MEDIDMQTYAHPEVLVSTDWVMQHLHDPKVTLVEVDVDTTSYNEGHIAGAVGWNWQTQLCDPVRREIITKADLERLLSQAGIKNDSTIVLYGDNNNWFAAWAFWQLKMYGHADVRLMNGGRKKWMAEGKELSKDAPAAKLSSYKAPGFSDVQRAYRRHVEDVFQSPKAILIDVRSNDEFTGKILSPPGLPETCQRGGHIPRAKNVPWATACNDDGTFKSPEELHTLYSQKGVTPDKEIIAYCRIGERSSHTWFVLKYLLGYPNVKNYDGSWTEWGNLVNAPIEKG